MEYRIVGKTSLKVSTLAFGGSSLSNMYVDSTGMEENVETVRAALHAGINFIDLAPWYGQGRSEQVVGKVLKEFPRESVVISTKVGRYEKEVQNMFDFSSNKTKESVERSLQLLGTDYLDIVQVHDVEFAPSIDVILNETLPALRQLQDEGKVHFIGITGYPMDTLVHIIKRSLVKIDVVLNYGHFIVFNTSLSDYVEFFKKHDVAIINAAPHGMGLLTNDGPAKWHPAGQDLRDVCSKAAKFCQSQGVDISRLSLHFSLQNKDVAATVVGMGRIDRLNANIDVYKNGISAKEEAVLSELHTKFFKDIKENHWEDVEVVKYRSKLEEYKSSIAA